MTSGLWAIAKLDLLMWRRSPLAIISALAPPIGMTLILFTLSMAVKQQPVALVVEGTWTHSELMRSIIESDTDAYVNSDFSDNLQPTDTATAKKLLDSQQIAAIIKIPADFDQQVDNGQGKVQLILNNVDIDFADDIRKSVDRSVTRLDAPSLATNNVEEAGEAPDPSEAIDPLQPNPYRIAIDEHDLRKTNVDWLHYQIISALILLILSVGLIGTALLCAQDIDRKTSRYLALAPQSPWSLVAGRLMGGVLASLAALVPALIIFCLMGVVVPPAAHWPALMAIFVATAICASGLGAIIGTSLRGSRTISMAASVTATYMFFLGGGFTTIAFLPQWLQNISSFIPIRYAIDGMRQALFYPDLNGVAIDLTVLCLTAAAAVTIGSFMVRRSWSR